jgi:hypothetical protein
MDGEPITSQGQPQRSEAVREIYTFILSLHVLKLQYSGSPVLSKNPAFVSARKQ